MPAPLILAPPDKIRRLAELRTRLREQEAERRKTEGPRWSTPGELARAIDPATVQTPALDLIDEALVWAYTTPGARLAVSLPPQEGKSSRVTKTGSLWALSRDPELRIGIVSYAQSLADGFGREIRNLVVTHDGTEGTLDLGLRVASDYGSARRWQLDGHRGGVVAAGVGSGLTGRPLDCFTGSTEILTDRGYIRIRDIYQSSRRINVLSWNHDERQAEWKPVVAARRIPDREVVEVVTVAGRRFTCTPDHRIYTADGYRQAALLRPGDALTVGWLEGHAKLPDVRQGQEEHGRRDVPRLLHGGTGIDVPDPVVRPLRQGIPAHARRAREEAAARAGEPLLLTGLRVGIAAESRQAVPQVRYADGIGGSGSALLLGGVPHCREAASEDQALPAVRRRIRLLQHAARALRREVRRRRPFGPDGRRGKLALQDRHQLRRVVPADAPADQGARPDLPGMLPARQAVSGYPARQDGHADKPARSPHRRAAVELPAGEPDPGLQVVPPGAPQIGRDTVSMVRRLRGESHDVYDIQVAGNHNFFAGEVLAHNCIVIDDPFADAIQAGSSYYRDRVWDWWQTVGSTRLAPDAPVLVICTRWHEDDFVGRLIGAEDGSRWRVINIPALADHKPELGQADPLGRQPGEWLASARRRTAAQWEQIRIQAGSRAFTALYQGRPSPDQGNVWQRQWWRRYQEPLWSQHPTTPEAWLVQDADEVLISVDCAFKDTKSSDFVVMQTWVRRGAMAYLVDQVRKRLSFTDTVTALLALIAKWPQASRKLIEDKANGSAVISSLKSKVPGLVPVNPTDSKYGRATAVAPFIESGNVLLPAAGVGLFDPSELIEEAAGFPNAAHDDQVDTTSQALAEMFLDGTGAQAWLAWAKRKAEQAAAGQLQETSAAPGITPASEPEAAQSGGAPQRPAVTDGPEPGTWLVRSSDGQRDYTVTADGRCDCQAGTHGKRCRHVAEAHATVDPAVLLRLARDAAFRAMR